MALYYMPTGIIPEFLNDLELFADSSGRQVKVRSGGAFVRGVYYDNDELEIVPLGANSSGNPRRDLVTVRVDITGVPAVVGVHVTPGTPAGSPSTPAIVNTATIWEFALGWVAVANGASTINTGDVTKTPLWARPRGMPVHAKCGNGVVIGRGIATSVKTATGKFTITLENAMSTANYTIQATPESDVAVIANIKNSSADSDSFEVWIYDAAGTLTDPNWIHVSAQDSEL